MKINKLEKKDLEQGTVILKFGSESCSPCKDLDIKLNLLEKEKIEDLSIKIVSLDDNIEIMNYLIEEGIIKPFLSIPQTYIFKNGKKTFELIGSDINKIKENI